MLSITGGYTRNCEGPTRRDFLRIGSLGLASLSLPQLLSTQAQASGTEFVKNKSVVLLFLQGGPTHIETFDPKMTAPQEYRAMFGEVPTSLPGVTFGSHFPGLAARAESLAVVRSYSHGIGNHQTASEHVAAGGNSLKATMGTLYSRVAGATNPHTGIPNNAVLPPPAAGDKFKNLGANTSRVTNIGGLPTAYKAFDPSAGGQILKDMELRMSGDRLDDRRSLLTRLDSLRRAADASGTLEGADQYQQQAFEVIVGGVGQAFDLSREDPKLVARYDTGRFAIPPYLQKKKSNVPRQSPIALGKQMLLARRLVEAGCRFVTVTSAGWDMHGNAFGVNDGMPLLGPAVDKAASAFLDDLKQRGLSDDVLLIITGEFGRTPRINKKGGRDHWGSLCPIVFAGGGLNMGQVIGSSDKTASKPASEQVDSSQVRATVMHTLFDIGQLRLVQSIPGDVSRVVQEGEPIPHLI